MLYISSINCSTTRKPRLFRRLLNGSFLRLPCPPPALQAVVGLLFYPHHTTTTRWIIPLHRLKKLQLLPHVAVLSVLFPLLTKKKNKNHFVLNETFFPHHTTLQLRQSWVHICSLQKRANKEQTSVGIASASVYRFRQQQQHQQSSTTSFNLLSRLLLVPFATMLLVCENGSLSSAGARAKKELSAHKNTPDTADAPTNCSLP